MRDCCIDRKFYKGEIPGTDVANVTKRVDNRIYFIPFHLNCRRCQVTCYVTAVFTHALEIHSAEIISAKDTRSAKEDLLFMFQVVST